MIILDKVSYQIESKTILDSISTEIPKSQITALIGPNGAGKSSLLSLIARLTPLQSGQIHVDDLNIATTETGILAKKLAILTQSSAISTRLTVRELVTFGRFPHHQGRPTAADDHFIDHTLALFDLMPLASDFMETLSGGQRQKALIAMCYAQDTDYLLLDEPLNNLDMKTARDLMMLLADLSQNSGKTIILVVHEINYAALYADWILGMRDGRLIISDHKQACLTPDILYKIYQSHFTLQSIHQQPFILHYGYFPNEDLSETALPSVENMS